MYDCYGLFVGGWRGEGVATEYDDLLLVYGKISLISLASRILLQ